MVVNTFKVPMRDKTLLHTIVIKPEETGRFPIVLIRCPYTSPYAIEDTVDNLMDFNWILKGIHNEFEDFISNGYAVILQHARGTGNSGGEFIHSLHECDDACDTLDWIRKQDFYNHEIYRFGMSYLGMTSLIDAKYHHEDVKGIVAFQPVMWFYLSQVNGVFNTGWRGKWTATIEAMAGRRDLNYDINVFRTFPQKDWGELICGHKDYIFDINHAHPYEDDPFYRTEAPGYEIFESLEFLQTPTLFICGWFDLLVSPNLRAWNEMIPESTREKCAMIMTPYDHSSLDTMKPEGFAKFDMLGSELKTFAPHYAVDWFNHQRQGTSLGNIKEGQIAFFPVAGHNQWFYECGSLNDASDVKTLYLNHGRLLGTRAEEITEITYLYNPYNPAWFWNAANRFPGIPRSNNEGVNPIMQDQDPPNSRYDIISFTGYRFDKHCFIKGSIEANLAVKSDCEDTCFYIRVCVVKDGIAYCIRDDIRTLCHELREYQPGNVVNLKFKTSAICWEINPGDEIRIDISSSAFPVFAPHTNVKATIQAEVEKPKYAHNTILCGNSFVTIPVEDTLENYPSISL